MRILGIGEILWDLLPAGPRLGGAPFNVIAHLARLGHETRFATGVGADDGGTRTIEEIEARGVGTQLVQVVEGAPTGTAAVELDADGVARFEIARNVAYERLALTTELVRETIDWKPDALVFGTLAQQSPTVIGTTQRLVHAVPQSLRLYDVNLRAGGWAPELADRLAAMATVIKLNEDEVAVMADLGWGSSASLETFARETAARFDLRAVSITRGAAGAALLADGHYAEAPAPGVEVVDTVGAGDAFAAALVDGLLGASPLDEVLARANALGALVASRPGAIPAWSPDELNGLMKAAVR